MTDRVVTFHRLAFEAIREAVRWYRIESIQAAQHFEPALLDALERIAASAESCPIAMLDVRWARIKNYPYLLYFLILDDQHCRVIAAAHASRRPGFWLRRLKRP